MDDCCGDSRHACTHHGDQDHCQAQVERVVSFGCSHSLTVIVSVCVGLAVAVAAAVAVAVGIVVATSWQNCLFQKENWWFGVLPNFWISLLVFVLQSGIFLEPKRKNHVFLLLIITKLILFLQQNYSKF